MKVEREELLVDILQIQRSRDEEQLEALKKEEVERNSLYNTPPPVQLAASGSSECRAEPPLGPPPHEVQELGTTVRKKRRSQTSGAADGRH